MNLIFKAINMIKEAWAETINTQTEDEDLELKNSAPNDNFEELEWTADNNSDDLEFGDHHAS